MMQWKPAIQMRRWHRWATVFIALPFLVVLVSGVLLQVKKEFDWIQPPTQQGVGGVPQLSFEEILTITRRAEHAGITHWSDIDRLDVRPDKGIVKVRGTNHWEVQIDTQTGAVLHVAKRRSGLIESLHDGSWFHERAKLWIFLPSALLVFALWGTGLYLFVLPYWIRWKKPRRPRAEADGVRPARLPE